MYPPLDTLKPVAQDVWIVDSGPLHYLGVELPTRMTVIRLRSGALWLHSPTRATESLQAEIDRLGPVGHIVAPNIAHWVSVKEWQALPSYLTQLATALNQVPAASPLS